jgi:hypothetical protein
VPDVREAVREAERLLVDEKLPLRLLLLMREPPKVPAE